MQERLKKVASQLAGFWKALSKKKKAIIIGVTTGVAIFITLLVLLTTRVSYSALYLGLDDAEAGQVLDKVEAMNVPVKVEGSGNIYVDSKQVDSVKMKLAEQGYPQTTLTYDTFMKGTSWAMTDSDKQKLALYQVQDRLQSTIRTIPGIKNVIVNIANQDDNGYVLSTSSQDVTASVKVNLAPGAGLTTQQVKGIVLLVSKSVPNLSEKNVAVLDSDGAALSGDASDTSGTTNANLALQTQVENMAASKIRSILEPIFGDGKVKVAAGVTMDFSQSVTNKTTYSPNSNGLGVPQSTDTTVEGPGTGTTASGVAGVTGVSQYATSSAQSSGGTVNSSAKTTYLVDTINQQIQDNGGKISKLTVAVVLDNKAAAAYTDSNALKQTIAYALGVNPTDVSVQLAPFASDTAATNKSNQLINNWVLYAAAGAGILLVIAIIAIMLAVGHGRRIRALKEAAQDNATAVVAQQVNAKGLPGKGLPNSPGLADASAQQSAPQGPGIDEILENTQSQATKQVESFADKKPELVAQILRNWLKDQ